MNFVILKGHIGQNPIIKTLENGRKVMSFSLATTSRYKASTGEWVDEPAIWHNIVAWGYLTDNPIEKGNLVEVKGKITNRSYQKDDETRYVTEIVATELDIIRVMRKSPTHVDTITTADDPFMNRKSNTDADGFTMPTDPINKPNRDKLPF